MCEDRVNEKWSKFIKNLTESPRADWGDWSDAAEQAGPYDDNPMDDDRELGRVMITLSSADERTIQNAIRQGMDESGILTHILDELNRD